jgi:pimeloyl-ACP methyl ester carboxylesterase
VGDRVQVVDIPGAGHFMILEQPDAVHEAVLRFLGTALR